MQSAETVLGVLRERGRRGLPCEELYRQLFNPQLYLLAYGRIYANKGAMTPGATQETVDGMSAGKIGRIIDAMRHERYRFHPVRRVYIPKENGKTRPLGLPTWSDKLVGEVVRLLLEAYYEPIFSDRSHGFRPHRGCHTALFLRLVRNMLTAGYLEDWTWGATLSGAPQGGVASPVLSNIYLHKLDVFIETVLIPQYTRGERRTRNPAYREVEHAIARARRRGDRTQARALRKRLHSLPSQDMHDPGYRRLRYLRYADDTLLGFAGPKAEAKEIKQRLAEFLREDLMLEMSPDKTLITHARTGAAKFLGYEITVQHDEQQLTRGRRAVNGQIKLLVPESVIKAKSAPYLSRGKPACRNPLHTVVLVDGCAGRRQLGANEFVPRRQRQPLLHPTCPPCRALESHRRGTFSQWRLGSSQAQMSPTKLGINWLRMTATWKPLSSDLRVCSPDWTRTSNLPITHAAN
jgi:hypothetical protein